MSTPLDRLRARLARKAAAGGGRRAVQSPRSQATDEEPAATGASGLPSQSGSDAEGGPVVPAGGATVVGRVEPPPGPRLVRRVVWGYAVGALPLPWLMGYKRLKALLEREGFAIRVDLLPLTSLPENVDLLFVPDELAEPARAVAPDAGVIVLEGRPEQAVFQELVTQLRSGTDLQAPSAAPDDSPAPEAESAGGGYVRPRGKIVRYQGWERID